MNHHAPKQSEDTLKEIKFKTGPSFRKIQDLVDDYIKNTSQILSNPTDPVSPFVKATLYRGLEIMHLCKKDLDELDFYRMKYTPVLPDELEISNLKNCYIGKCKCGQLLLQSKDKCCPKCNQFIFWPPKPDC